MFESGSRRPKNSSFLGFHQLHQAKSGMVPRNLVEKSVRQEIPSLINDGVRVPIKLIEIKGI